MDIHEYQAKELLARFGVPVPRGGLAYSPEQAAYRARDIGGEAWVVKAQIHSGGRGKAGGVKLCRSDREIEDAADELLGKVLVTEQTGARGKLVSRLYVEPAVRWQRELYLGFVLAYFGLSIMLTSLWVLLLLIPVLLILQRGVVEREEEYLERQFGDTYRKYKARVPRWL